MNNGTFHNNNNNHQTTANPHSVLLMDSFNPPSQDLHGKLEIITLTCFRIELKFLM